MGKGKTKVYVLADTQSETLSVRHKLLSSKRDYKVILRYNDVILQSKTMTQGEAYSIVGELLEALDLDGTVTESHEDEVVSG